VCEKFKPDGYTPAEIETYGKMLIPDFSTKALEKHDKKQQRKKHKKLAMAAYKEALSEYRKSSEERNVIQSKKTVVEEIEERESSVMVTRPSRGSKKGAGFYYELGGAAPSGPSGMDYRKKRKAQKLGGKHPLSGAYVRDKKA